MMGSENPVLIELTRGALCESRHRGALAIARPDGELALALGDVTRPVFPRSAIKALQALPLIETGAADRYGFGAREIALACASHSGSDAHASLAAAMLASAGLTAAALGCGAHDPRHEVTLKRLIRAGESPSALFNNCSGKHAGMLATARHMGEPAEGYWRPEHLVQERIVAVLRAFTGAALGPDVRGTDGCSVPNWAIPLQGLATAFARFISGEGQSASRREAALRIQRAVWAEPEMVAGPGRPDTLVMSEHKGQVFIKTGAEGVYVGALPALGLGFALKIDDGTPRASEAVMHQVVARLVAGASHLAGPRPLRNWRGIEVGAMRPAEALLAGLEGVGQ